MHTDKLAILLKVPFSKIAWILKYTNNPLFKSRHKTPFKSARSASFSKILWRFLLIIWVQAESVVPLESLIFLDINPDGSLSNTLMERKLRMPQIQGVQGRRPYAAASQQPSTASPWHALVYTSAGDRGIPSAFPKVHLPCRRRQKGVFYNIQYFISTEL